MYPGVITSDIIVIINEIEHPIYKRQGYDLLLKKDISLVDSLCGFKFIVEHPDRRFLVISSKDIIKDRDIKCVETGGMPIKGDTFNNGKLFIVFNIIYPKKEELDNQSLKIFKSILNKAPSYKKFMDRSSEKDLDEDEDIEHHTLSYIDPKLFGKKNDNRSAHDSDSDEEGNPQQCKTM